MILCEDYVYAFMNTNEKYIKINVCTRTYIVLKIPKEKCSFAISTQNFLKNRRKGEKLTADSDSTKKKACHKSEVKFLSHVKT